MDERTMPGVNPGDENPDAVEVMAIGAEQLKEFTAILHRYKAGKARTEERIKSAENWWMLRNTAEEQKETMIGMDKGFASKSGWLHNVVVSKHADAMEAYPEPNILPREEGDKMEAKMLSSILPCILEANDFERTYSEAMWQKLKTGTGCYKIVWDKNKLHGLGDIAIERVNLLNIFWEPGVTDIQRSRYVFHTELWDKDLLEERYPQLKNKLNSNTMIQSQFQLDDHADDENKRTVIEVYYHKLGRLHYVKYVEDQVLFASENEPEMRERGFYDHGKYPYFFDALFPIEGSPLGYGYIDLCKNPQTEIDLLKTAMVKNAMVGASPRYFNRMDGNINEEEFLNLSKPIVHVSGNVDETSLRPIDYNGLGASYITMLDRSIEELRETSGNTETATGTTSSGVTAASAIAALQQASGKGSADSTRSSYRVYADMIEMCIELIRQFYDLPRQFRIVGQFGAEEYVSYSNQGIAPQYQGMAGGVDLGYRVPAFDVKVSAQKQNVYTKVSQNELALQFFQLGFFNPQMADQTMMCLGMMDFEGKEEIMQRVSQLGLMQQKLAQYMQMSLMMAQESHPDMVAGISQDIMATMGGGAPVGMAPGGAPVKLHQQDNIAGVEQKEPTIVSKARQRSADASQPEANKEVK